MEIRDFQGTSNGPPEYGHKNSSSSSDDYALRKFFDEAEYECRYRSAEDAIYDCEESDGFLAERIVLKPEFLKMVRSLYLNDMNYKFKRTEDYESYLEYLKEFIEKAPANGFNSAVGGERGLFYEYLIQDYLELVYQDAVFKKNVQMKQKRSEENKKGKEFPLSTEMDFAVKSEDNNYKKIFEIKTSASASNYRKPNKNGAKACIQPVKAISIIPKEKRRDLEEVCYICLKKPSNAARNVLKKGRRNIKKIPGVPKKVGFYVFQVDVFVGYDNHGAPKYLSDLTLREFEHFMFTGEIQGISSYKGYSREQNWESKPAPSSSAEVYSAA